MTYEKDWLTHVRAELVPAFPRDFSFKRFNVLTEKHYLTLCNLLNKNNGSGYVSVYSQFEYQNHIASCLYYDVDGEDILETSKFVLQMLQQIDKYKPLIVFTGGRGFHVFIHFPPIQADIKKAGIYVLENLDGLEWEKYIDKHGLGNWRAMCIVPYTFHRKTLFLSRIVRYPQITQANKQLAIELSEKFKQQENFQFDKTDNSLNVINGFLGDEFPPCIFSLLQKLSSERELSHEGRVFLANFLVHAGFEPSEVKQLFVLANDFRKEITDYQVEYIVRRNLKLYSCSTLINLGLCPLPIQHCKYYPSLNWWF